MAITAALLLLVFTFKIGSSSGGNAVYPPTTIADAHALADGSKVSPEVFSRDTMSLPPCKCSISVVVPRGLSKKQTAAALLKAFFAENLNKKVDDNGDPYQHVLLFGYFTPNKGIDGYTAGRIEMEHQTDGSHTMTIDVGNALHNDEHRLSW